MKKWWFIWIILGIILISLDRITKYFFTSTKELLATNSGGLFGMFQGYNFIILILSIILIIILFWFIPRFKTLEQIGIVFIVSGLISNSIDRALYGGVMDFIQWGAWPTFNLADSSMVGGVLWILLLQFYTEK